MHGCKGNSVVFVLAPCWLRQRLYYVAEGEDWSGGDRMAAYNDRETQDIIDVKT